MNYKELIEKNLITIIAVLIAVLPEILTQISGYIPTEYSTLFGILILIIGKAYQVNNFDTVIKIDEENRSNLEDQKEQIDEKQ
jgi:hypothetical protein